MTLHTSRYAANRCPDSKLLYCCPWHPAMINWLVRLGQRGQLCKASWRTHADVVHGVGVPTGYDEGAWVFLLSAPIRAWGRMSTHTPHTGTCGAARCFWPCSVEGKGEGAVGSGGKRQPPWDAKARAVASSQPLQVSAIRDDHVVPRAAWAWTRARRGAWAMCMLAPLRPSATGGAGLHHAQGRTGMAPSLRPWVGWGLGERLRQ